MEWCGQANRGKCEAVKILIVDDEPLVRKSLSRACRARGHEVLEAADGTDGLEKWQTSKPDLVFLDVLMPGLSGPELLRVMTQSPSQQSSFSAESCIVILMSAFAGEHNMETALAMGANLFIPKPFDDIFEVVTKGEGLFAKRSQG